MNYGRDTTSRDTRIRLIDPVKKTLNNNPLINVLYSLPLEAKVLYKIKQDIEEYNTQFSEYCQFKRNNFKSTDPVDIWEGALFELAHTLRFNPEYTGSNKDYKFLPYIQQGLLHEERFVYIMQNIIKSLPFPESFKIDSLECLDGFDYIDNQDTIAEIIRSISLQIRDYVYGYELLHNFN